MQRIMQGMAKQASVCVGLHLFVSPACHNTFMQDMQAAKSGFVFCL